jgi:hypothetical protein
MAVCAFSYPHAHAHACMRVKERERGRELEYICPSFIHQHVGLCLFPQWINVFIKFCIKHSTVGDITFVMFNPLLWNFLLDS